MKSRQFIIADVFTEERFGGNQLAVFTDASGFCAIKSRKPVMALFMPCTKKSLAGSRHLGTSNP